MTTYYYPKNWPNMDTADMIEEAAETARVARIYRRLLRARKHALEQAEVDARCAFAVFSNAGSDSAEEAHERLRQAYAREKTAREALRRAWHVSSILDIEAERGACWRLAAAPDSLAHRRPAPDWADVGGTYAALAGLKIAPPEVWFTGQCRARRMRSLERSRTKSKDQRRKYWRGVQRAKAAGVPWYGRG